MVGAALQPQPAALGNPAEALFGNAASSIELELSAPAMGGILALRVACPASAAALAEHDLRLVAARVETWARRLTRFSEASDLSRLNADPGAPLAQLRPTIADVLAQAARLSVRTEGSLDVGLLDERLAAEDGRTWASAPLRRWRLEGRGRERMLLRDGHIRFDLDGVAKGWIADRALRLLRAYPDALVDADGDVAMRTSGQADWSVAVGDPFDETSSLATLVVPRGKAGGAVGISTSGTSVHRWQGPDGPRHHIIDPRLGRSARTDVVQATVVAESALAAEALAKSAVISGSDEGLDLLERSGAWAAVLSLESGEVRATPQTSVWLA